MSTSIAPAGVAPLTNAQATFSAPPTAVGTAPTTGAAAPVPDLQAVIQALAVAVQALTDALAGAGMIAPTATGASAAPMTVPTSSSTPGMLDAITGASDAVTGASGGVSTSGGGGSGGCACSQASSGAGALGSPVQGAFGAPEAKPAKRKKQPKGQGGGGAAPAAAPAPAQSVTPFQGASGGKLVHPLPGARMTSHYGEVSSIRSGAHDGTDFAKAAGSPIRSAAAGKVVEVEYHSAYGNTIVIDHGNGFRTKYAHMLSKSPLAVGATVQAGETIGKVGSTGNSTGPHLHFMLLQNGKDINPEPYLSGAKTL